MQYIQSSKVSGLVIEEKSQLALSGVRVKWMVDGLQKGKKAISTIELGFADTNQNGWFEIQATEDQQTQEALCRFSFQKDSKSFLSIIDKREKVIGKPAVITSMSQEIILFVPPEQNKPSQRQWKDLTNYLMTNRMILVKDVVQQLSSPYSDSPSEDWSSQTRAFGIRTILNAITTKKRSVNNNSDLLEQNQFIHPLALESGNIRKGVTYYLNPQPDPQNLQGFLDHSQVIFPGYHKSNIELYRDYLRSVWVLAAQKMYESPVLPPHAKPSDSIFEDQLDGRFHQNFHTSDDTLQPSTKLVIPILVSILLTDINREGFGLKPASIPLQGTSTDDEYLQKLVILTNVSARELLNRFRISFDRMSENKVSPIQLNVEALLGLLSDTYQSYEEPFNATPIVLGDGKPLIFNPFLGRAPFFLEYEEWLERQGTFYPENIYNIRKNIPIFNATYRNNIENRHLGPLRPDNSDNTYFDDTNDMHKSAEWVQGMYAVTDKLGEATSKIDAQQYNDALIKLTEAFSLLEKAASSFQPKWIKDKFYWYNNGTWNNSLIQGKTYLDILISLVDRSKLHVNNPDELIIFESFFNSPEIPTFSGQGNFDAVEPIDKGLAKSRTLYIYNVFYLGLVMIPYLRSTIHYTLGNYAEAIRNLSSLTGYIVGVSESTSQPGYSPSAFSYFYQDNTLPYTTQVEFKDGAYSDILVFGAQTGMTNIKSGSPDYKSRMALAPFEKRFFKLAQADAMLGWADQLYRNDDPSSIRRARELYKGTLFLHREDPEITPNFSTGLNYLFHFQSWNGHDNPAKVSQINRAKLALFQIENGLNAYGYREDMVPVLRYKPLKQAADLFATSAKSAQTDFLSYMVHYEQALIEIWQTQSMVKKAKASSGIASEHIAIAQAGVQKAQELVTAVQAQIVAKQAEIADHDSFFAQASDFYSGIKDSLKSMVPLAKNSLADDSAVSSVTGDQMLAIFGKGATGGAGAAKDAATATLGAGAAFMVGFGTFIYTSYTSMQAMSDASNKRLSDLKSLQGSALPVAKAQVRLKERDVIIANFEMQIAAADSEYAGLMFRFQQDRFLSADFWNKLSIFANRLMRRYVELGARTAWIAERALEYEQNRGIQIIKLNYFPTSLRGVTGADSLLADLAELEATRLQGLRLTTPVKHTISLVKDFPIQFGQLKKTGRCMLHTFERDLHAAYPGTFGYRIRTVSVEISNPDGPPPRGILRNQGISRVWREDFTANPIARFPDALALSEFSLHNDLFVYGLPGETLLQFEGSGFETDWELVFPIDSNPEGFKNVTDVLITFDMNAFYSQSVATKQALQTFTNRARSIMVSASNIDPQGLKSLKSATGPISITFDPTKLALPPQEVKRIISNIAIICVGQTNLQYNVVLTAYKSGKTASFSIDDGIALSNDGPLLGTSTPLPLNNLLNISVNQPFVLEFKRIGVEEELKKLFDVVLYLEYDAIF